MSLKLKSTHIEEIKIDKECEEKETGEKLFY